MDDSLIDTLRWWATEGTEDGFVDTYARQIFGKSHQEPDFWNVNRFNLPAQPVVGVNWHEAMAYAAWLARVTHRLYRLPSEAEWEWAARRNIRRYPWGHEWDAGRCNWRGSALNQPNPIGVYPYGATEEGLQEMAGNVYEWTASLFRIYPYVPGDGREDVQLDGLRAVRGGSWYTDSAAVRCTSRIKSNPWGRRSNFGFRLAASVI